MSSKVSISIGLFLLLFPVFSTASNIRYLPYTYSLETVCKWVSADQFVICDKCKPVECDLKEAIQEAHKASIMQDLHTPRQSGLNSLMGLAIKNYFVKKIPAKYPKPKTVSECSNPKVILEVYFAFDSYSFTKEAKDKLNTAIKQYQGQTLFVKGYTDHIGSKKYNVKLADKRANSVAEYLKKHGIKVEVLENASAFGINKLDNLNRCVEIYVCK